MASVVQDFTAMPLRWTRQAPHCEVSQPTWVPVSRNCSRRNWTSKVRVSTSAVTGLPFTGLETDGMRSLLQPGVYRPVSHTGLSSGIQNGTKAGVFRLFPSLEQEQLEPRAPQ